MDTITFQCYSCQQVLKVGADKAGRKAKCAKCGTVLTIPTAAAEAIPEAPLAEAPVSARRGPAPEDTRVRPKAPPPVAEIVEDDVPRRRSRRDEDDEDQDDRPRSRRRPAEDEEYERPRRRSRGADEDDDDDEPRGRRRQDDDDYEDDDRPRRARDRDDDESFAASPKLFRAQLRAVRAGLTCYWWRWLLFSICLSVAVIGLIMAVALAPTSPRAAAIVSLILMVPAGLGHLASTILGIIGASFCVRVPPRSGYRGLAIAQVILEPLPLAFAVVAVVTSGTFSIRDPFAGARLGLLFYALCYFCFLAGFIVSMLFFRGLAIYSKDKYTGRSAITAMIQGLIAFIAVPVVLGLLVMVLRHLRLGQVASLVILAVVYIAWIVLLAMTGLRITQLIATIRGKL